MLFSFAQIQFHIVPLCEATFIFRHLVAVVKEMTAPLFAFLGIVHAVVRAAALAAAERGLGDELADGEAAAEVELVCGLCGIAVTEGREALELLDGLADAAVVAADSEVLRHEGLGLAGEAVGVGEDGGIEAGGFPLEL